MNPKNNQILTLPGAIIVAAAIIAVAIIWIKKPATTAVTAPSSAQVSSPQLNMPTITADDHILGNPSAPVKIVEYSDPSCPYCKMFNPTMVQIMNNYGSNGKVAWIYRDFPLDQPNSQGQVLHPNAGNEAEGFECAASLGGNTKFWAFEKDWYNIFPLQGATDRSVADDSTQLGQVAKDVGIDPVAFSDCLASAKFADKIKAEYIGGVNAGASGTPYSIIIGPTGSVTVTPIVGAQSYSTVKSAIDALLSSGN